MSRLSIVASTQALSYLRVLISASDFARFVDIAGHDPNLALPWGKLDEVVNKEVSQNCWRSLGGTTKISEFERLSLMD
jgi:hypothetical protein